MPALWITGLHKGETGFSGPKRDGRGGLEKATRAGRVGAERHLVTGLGDVRADQRMLIYMSNVWRRGLTRLAAREREGRPLDGNNIGHFEGGAAPRAAPRAAPSWAGRSECPAGLSDFTSSRLSLAIHVLPHVGFLYDKSGVLWVGRKR